MAIMQHKLWIYNEMEFLSLWFMAYPLGRRLIVKWGASSWYWWGGASNGQCEWEVRLLQVPDCMGGATSSDTSATLGWIRH